jgi:uncharacterized damage-inducible protein DinB
MITPSHSQLMAQYNEWMNSRLYALCATLPDTELGKDRGAFFKSIYGTLNHIAYGDLAFLSRFTGSPARMRNRARRRGGAQPRGQQSAHPSRAARS